MKKNIVPLFFTTALLLTACGGKEYSPMDYIAGSLAYRDGFKILQLTDIHMSDKDDQDLHYALSDRPGSERFTAPDGPRLLHACQWRESGQTPFCCR